MVERKKGSITIVDYKSVTCKMETLWSRLKIRIRKNEK